MPFKPRPGAFPPVRQVPLPGPHILRGVAPQLAGLFKKDSALLVLVDDWALYRPAEMELLLSLRAEDGEHRSLIDAHGHYLKREDQPILPRLLELLLGFESQWSFYIHSMPSKMTLLFWEADILDAWGRGSRLKEVEEILEPTRKAIKTLQPPSRA